MPISIKQIPCFQDNYGFLIRDDATGLVASIDSPEPEKINAALEAEGWQLNFILNTHHHWDHAGGNLALKERWGCQIIAPKGEADKIPGADQLVVEGDQVEIGESRASVIETPGHTSGHIIYHFAENGVAFVGDTIFALGCGRLFEGTPQQMWTSLSKIAALPDDTKLYCAHEYTEANARFALSVEPQNQALAAHTDSIFEARRAGKFTVPTTVATEKAVSPFMRAEDPTLAATLGLTGADPVEVFAEVRKRKDDF